MHARTHFWQAERLVCLRLPWYASITVILGFQPLQFTLITVLLEFELFICCAACCTGTAHTRRSWLPLQG